MNLKKIFITGANRGIGKGILSHYLKTGASPENIFVGVRNVDTTMTELEKEGLYLPKASFLHLDLESLDSIENLREHFESNSISVSTESLAC